MEWIWNAAMAWLGWNVLAPMAAFLGIIVIVGMILAAIAVREKFRAKRR